MSFISRVLEQISDEEKRAGESQCFISHEFGQKDLRAKLVRALERLHLRPYFADKEVTGDFILSKVCKKILITRASIVDLTKANPNVYFELGVAIGMNKPVFLVLKGGESVPSLLDSFIKVRFTHYAALEEEIVAQVPDWLQQSVEHHVRFNNHCHFVNVLCPDRQRLTPQRHYLVIDEQEERNRDGRLSLEGDPDFRAEVKVAMKGFQFKPVFLDEVATDSSFRLCDYCRSLRNSKFALCHIGRRSSNNAYLLLGLVTGLGIPSLLMVNEELDRSGSPKWEVPTLLKGLDAFYYTHATDIAERLGNEVQSFLDRYSSIPISRKVLFSPEEFRREAVEEFGEEDFGETGLRVFEDAVAEAQYSDHAYLTPEHILNSLARREEILFDHIILSLNIDAQSVRNYLTDRLELIPKQSGRELVFAGTVTTLFSKAKEEAQRNHRTSIEATDLLLALAQDDESPLVRILRNFGVSPQATISQVQAAVLSLLDEFLGEKSQRDKPLSRLEEYKRKFGETGRPIIELAFNTSAELGTNCISTDYVINALAIEEPQLFHSVITAFSIDPWVVRKRVESRLAEVPKNEGRGFRILPETTDLFLRAMERARMLGGNVIEATDLLVSMSENQQGAFFTTLVSFGVRGESIAETVNAIIREREPERRTSEKRRGIDLGSYKTKFSESGQRVLETALEESRRRGQNYVGNEHIVWALARVESETFNGISRELSLDPVVIKLALERRLDAGRKHTGSGFRITPDATEIFKGAMERARAQGRRVIESTDIFSVLPRFEDGAFVEILRKCGVSAEVMIEEVRSGVARLERTASSENLRISSAYRDKFSESGQRVLEYALAECNRLGKKSLMLEHILDALAKCEPALFDADLSDMSVDPSAVRAAIEARLQDEVVQPGDRFRISPETTDLFKRSMELARTEGRKTISASDLLHAVSNYENWFTSTIKDLAGTQKKSGRILVVDDDPAINAVLKHLLEKDYSVDTALNGAQAIELFDHDPHELVLLDLQLPDIDGLTLLQHFKEKRPSTQVIVSTAFVSVAKAVEATKAGAWYFLEKPFDLEQLLPLVESALKTPINVSRGQQGYVPIPNPFSAGLIVSGESFFNRMVELATIIDATARRQSVSIVGPRRIGKSSLLRELYRRLSSLDYFPIYLDVSMFDSEASFIKTVDEKLRGTATRDSEAASAESPTLYDLQQRLENLHHARGVVLLLDEFHRPAVFSDVFFATLRAWATTGLLSLIVAHTEELAELGLESAFTSPLTNIFRTVRLTEFEPDEALRLATFNGRIDFSEREIDFIMTETKGHPYYIQMLCSRLIELKNRERGTVDLRIVGAEFRELSRS
jgi:ATP-dependent Clp protease ATP-binding subunit ClpA